MMTTPLYYLRRVSTLDVLSSQFFSSCYILALTSEYGTFGHLSPSFTMDSHPPTFRHPIDFYPAQSVAASLHRFAVMTSSRILPTLFVATRHVRIQTGGDE